MTISVLRRMLIYGKCLETTRDPGMGRRGTVAASLVYSQRSFCSCEYSVIIRVDSARWLMLGLRITLDAVTGP